MSLPRVTVPGAFLADWLPARKSWEGDIERAESRGRVLALLDAAPRNKRGGAVVKVNDLGADGLRWLCDEAVYWYEFNGGNRNPYGCEEPDAAARAAARRLILACCDDAA